MKAVSHFHSPLACGGRHRGDAETHLLGLGSLCVELGRRDKLAVALREKLLDKQVPLPAHLVARGDFPVLFAVANHVDGCLAALRRADPLTRLRNPCRVFPSDIYAGFQPTFPHRRHKARADFGVGFRQIPGQEARAHRRERHAALGAHHMALGHVVGPEGYSSLLRRPQG
eukprot:scaffold109_cov252-Pinguiococcus_pyrenoidosus.AAC.66